MILHCVLLKDTSLVFAVGLGSEISLEASLCVVIRPQHITICWLSIQCFIFLLTLSRDPQGQFRSNRLLNSTVSCELAGNFISLYPSVPQNIQGPKKAPHYARWKCHLTPFGTVVPMEMLFWQPEGLLEPHDCQSIHLNFMSTGQNSIYLSSENCSILS